MREGAGEKDETGEADSLGGRKRENQPRRNTWCPGGRKDKTDSLGVNAVKSSVTRTGHSFDPWSRKEDPCLG